LGFFRDVESARVRPFPISALRHATLRFRRASIGIIVGQDENARAAPTRILKTA